MSIPHELVKSFAKGHGVIVIGPELSIDAGCPSPEELLERLASKFDFDASQLSYQQVTQQVESAYGRDELVAFLREQLETLYLAPTAAHRLLVQLFAKQLLTTNMDRVVEHALNESDQQYDVILSSNEAKEIATHHEERLQLVKLYGDLSCATSLVITADDHELYPLYHPTLMRLLTMAWRSCSLLFVGYQHDDARLRRLLTQLRLESRELARQAALILFDSSQQVTQAYQRWGVQVINLEVESGESSFEGATYQHNAKLAKWLALFQQQIEVEREQQAAQLARRRPTLPDEPYKFLDAFTRKDGAIFHGRESESEQLYQQVLSSRLSVLYGESGVGKTSLLQASVVPRLKQAGYTVAYVRPLANPLEDVHQALGMTLGKGKRDSQPSTLRGFIESRLTEKQPLLIVLDQFEAIFDSVPSSTEQSAANHERFIGELIDAIQSVEREIRCLILLRNDYLDQLDAFSQILGHDALRDRMRLHNLTPHQARAAIVEPATAFNLSFEPALLNTLLADLQLVELPLIQQQRRANTAQIAPSQLQIVCTELWRTWQRSRSESALTLNHYQGAYQILQNYLENVIKELKQVQVRDTFDITLDSEVAQQAARQLLKKMIRIGQQQLAINRQEVSQRTLESGLKIEVAEVKRLLAYLSQRGVIRRLPNSKRHYELTHEVLLSKVWEWVEQAERHVLHQDHILQRATSDYREYGLHLSLPQLKTITEQASHLSLNQQSLTLLLVSSIEHHQDAGIWVGRMDSDYAIQELARLLSAHKRRQYAPIANALGQTRSVKAIPYLQELLQDKDNHVQRQAVDALISLDTPEVVHTLYYAARNEQQLTRVVPLIEGLEKLKHDEAAQMLSLLASDHSNPHSRSRAANALLYLGHSQGIHLIAQLASSENERIRQDAVLAAKRTWRENPSEFESMLNHYDPRIQMDALTVLAMVNEPDMATLLFHAFKNGSLAVRREAVKMLQQVEWSLPFEPLLPLLKDEDLAIRQAGMILLAQSGNKLAHEPLMRELRAGVFPIRLAATRAFGFLYELPILRKLGSDAAEERLKAAGMLQDDRHLHEALEAEENDEPHILNLRFELLKTALKDEVADVRRAVTSTLGQLADMRAADTLVTVLSDPAPQVRLEAARGLEENARQASISPRAVEALLNALADDDLQVRIAVARALGEIEDPRAIETLVAALEDDAAEVRMVVASILEQSPEMMKLPQVQAVDPLLLALSDHAPQVRMAAADALAQSGDQRAIEPLSVLLEDNDFLVRLSAIGALGSLYPLPALEKLGNEAPQKRRQAARELAKSADRRVLPPLLAALQDESSLVTIAVIEALGDLANTRAVEPLLAILPTASPQERIAIISALGQIADMRAVLPIIALLDDEQPNVRRRTAVVLAQLKDWQAVEPLIATLKDNDPQMRMAVANALGQLPDIRSLHPLIATLEDRIPRVRMAAVNALGQIDDPQVTDALLKALQDDEFLVRLAAIRALGMRWEMPLLWKLGSTRNAKERGQAASTLGTMNDARAVRPLMATLSDKSPKVRIEASIALGQLKDLEAIEALRAAKDDKNSRVRMEVARALRQLRRARKNDALAEKQAQAKTKQSTGAKATASKKRPAKAVVVDIQPELKRLSSGNPKRRRSAAAALGDLGQKRAVEPLIEIIADESSDVRHAVVRALERLNDARAIEPLVATLADNDFLVRLAAISALGVLWERLVLVQLGSESSEERLQGIQTIKSRLQLLAKIEQQGSAQDEESLNAYHSTPVQLLQPLITTLEDQVKSVRLAAAAALAEGARHVPQLYRQVVDSLLNKLPHELPDIEVAIMTALGETKQKQLAEPLKEGLQHDLLRVRLAATRALGSLWDVPLLARLGHEHAQIRQEAAHFLTNDLQPSAIIYRTCIRSVEPLLAALRDEVAAVRGEAAKALYSLGSQVITKEEVIHPLLTGLQYKDPAVRRHVARILAQLRNQKAIGALTTALQDQDAEVREQAAIALRYMGSSEVTYNTLKDLRSQDAVIRQRAASVLGPLRNKHAVEPLIDSLQDDDPMVRQESARSLGQLRDRRAIGSLTQAMQDDAFAVRLVAMRALAALWNIPALAQLGSESVDARQQAAETWPNAMQYYINTNDSRAVEPLLALLADEVAEVRIAVAVTLGRLKDKRALNALLKALHDEVPEVQNAVANALKELEDVRDVEQMVEQREQPRPRVFRRYHNEQHLKQRSTLRALGALWNQPVLAQLGSENMPTRLKAAKALAQTVDPQAVKPLIMALSDEAIQVRRAAANALGKLSDERAVEPLIACLQEHDQQLKITAITALGQLADAQSVMPLIALLQHDDLQIRLASVEALQHSDDQRALSALSSVLQEDDRPIMQRAVTKALSSLYDLPELANLAHANPQQRQDAAAALAKTGDTRVLDPLIMALKAQNETSAVKVSLVRAIVQLNDQRAINPLVEQLQEIRLQRSSDHLEVQRALIRALGTLYPLAQLLELSDPDAEIRLFATSAIGQSRDKRVIEPLLTSLQDDAMRLVVTRALGTLSGVSDLVQLGDNNAQTRQRAANALGQLGDKRVIEPLIAALNDSDVGVRRQVAAALGNIQDPRCVRPLLNALSDSSSKVRGQAANALHLVAEQELNPLLHALSHHESVSTRKHLARILGKFQHERTITALVHALQDEDVEVRKNAAISLRQLGDERAIEASLQALTAKEIKTRLHAAGVLGQLRDDRAVKPLITALRDENAQVRQEAARSLGQLRNQRAVKPLINALSDIDSEVRRRVANALKLLGDKQAINPLKKALKDSNPLVQQAANEALRVLQGK